MFISPHQKAWGVGPSPRKGFLTISEKETKEKKN
jgi:hypothetical protein